MPTSNHSLHKERLCWSRHVIQGACPCLPPITAYTKRGSVGADVSYWEHVLAYPDHSLHKERLCWSRCVILGACPCLPPITVYIKRGCWSISVTQVACSYIPPSLLAIKMLRIDIISNANSPFIALTINIIHLPVDDSGKRKANMENTEPIQQQQHISSPSS